MALTGACSSETTTPDTERVDGATHLAAMDAASEADGPLSSETSSPVDAGPTSTQLACHPGDRLDPLDKSVECSGGFCICRTYAPDGGSLVPLAESAKPGVHSSIISLKLSEPLKSGQSGALSVNLSNFQYTGTVEFWGANEECGPGLEKLSSEPFASNVLCSNVHPGGDYASVLYVRHFTGIASGSTAGQSYSEIYACAQGACP